jgi:formate/nitrite transporter FocA (FNT family)
MAKDDARRDEGFEEREIAEIEAHSAVRPPVMFEAIRRQGEEEMRRPVSALALSGLAAGIAMGFSVYGEAALAMRLPDAGWASLVSDLGYSAGFLIVILGQMQLFTENTITPVCSVLERPTRRMAVCLARIWTVVLTANIAGAALFALATLHGGAVDDALLGEMLAISEKAAGYSFLETLARGAPAGWLIAALVWLTPSAEGSRALLVILITYLIALGDLSHVVAGSAEAALLVFDGHADFADAYGNFVLPALIGNVLGGSALFTILVWGQIRSELPRGDGA